MDEHGKPVNLLAELQQIAGELHGILSNVTELQCRNENIREKRDRVEEEFEERMEPYKNNARVGKAEVFGLLRANGEMKRTIIELIKQLKDISRKIRDNKNRYQQLRTQLEKQQPRKLYKAIKGDIVDELFAEYINKLGCPVPIKRMGGN